MTEKQLALVEAIAENKLSDAKKAAIECCKEDTTQKNAIYVKRYLQILENGPSTLEVPFNVKGMAVMEDVSTFLVDRYYLSEREAELFAKIEKISKASMKLMEMGIPYLNSVLLTGSSGTGKTTFARFIAYKMKLPFIYINFSYLIDSYMGKTSQNLRSIFDFARTNGCVLLLDEIDCIAQMRKGSSEGTTREFNNTTITLLQELDKVNNDCVLLAATNIPEAIDPAVKRRFAIQHEVKPLTKEENIALIKQYLGTVELKWSMDEVEQYANRKNTVPQYDVINHLIQCISDAVVNDSDTVHI